MDQTLDQKRTLFKTLDIRLDKQLNNEKCQGSDNVLPGTQYTGF